MYPIRNLGPLLPLNIDALRKTSAGRKMLADVGRHDIIEQYKAERKRYKVKQSRPQSGPFLGWDGEGITSPDGVHRYVMLANSAGDCLVNNDGLATHECLEWIDAAGRRNNDCNHVGFSFGYDVNMILGDLSLVECQKLMDRGYLRWHDWYVAYNPGRLFKVAKLIPPYYKGNGQYIKDHETTIWDVFGFFQQSFVKALALWIPDDRDVAYITGMKARRDSFSRADIEDMARYCIMECRKLGEMMSIVRTYAKQVDLCPSSWYGPGAIATKALNQHKVKNYGDRNLAEGMGPIGSAARHAYFGGRIEMVQYGHHTDNVYAHDIVSAYPSVMADLPCLAHGTWIHNAPIPGRYTIARMKYTCPEIVGFHPIPYRLDDGRVLFPWDAHGWYWWPEALLLAAYTHEDNFLEESWTWVQECDHQPFSWVPKDFLKRQALKRDGRPAERILKLALNSLYGKLAQRLGGKIGPPPYHQLEWAGFITSTIRARMYQLASMNPASVIAFETDGVYTTEPLCENGDGSLGSWEVTQYDEIIYLQSGLYWIRKGNEWISKYRGLDPARQLEDGSWEGITKDMVLEGWRTGVDYLPGKSTRFRGMATSAISPERHVEWRQWITDTKDIALFPTGKRHQASECGNPADNLIPTIALPHGYPSDRLSAEHQLPWINGASDMQRQMDEYDRAYGETD
jgi:DNA polymerase type B, organellar and viral